MTYDDTATVDAPSDLEERLEFAVEAARQAGEQALRFFRDGVEVERKEDGSPVTEADHATERALREAIERRYRDDGILGEELGDRRGRSGVRWVLDPIDGTSAFASGVPTWGVLVSLEALGETAVPVLGVAHFPALGETVWAGVGLGAFWNGESARVSDVSRIEDARLLTTDLAVRPYARLGGARAATATRLRERWDALRSEVALARTWGDAWGYALVATGRAEAMVDPSLAVWDAAPLLPIIREAGGVFTDGNGRVTHAGGSAIASNAAIAEAIRERLGVGDVEGKGEGEGEGEGEG